MRTIVLGLVLVLSSCGAADPYAQPLPPAGDRQAIERVMAAVSPTDRQLLADYFARQSEAERGLIPPQAQAQTVAGAINDQRRTNEDLEEARARKQAAAELFERAGGGSDAGGIANLVP